MLLQTKYTPLHKNIVIITYQILIFPHKAQEKAVMVSMNTVLETAKMEK